MKNFSYKDLFVHLPIILWLIFFLCILSYKVITKPSPFFDWDESIYVQVGKEMIEAASPVPLWQGKAWLEKPPLVPFFYGVVMTAIPANPEISTRVASVFLSVIMLALLYVLVYKAQKSILFALLVTVGTSVNPIILHRAQIVNTDVFLLIGWLGYLAFYKNFKLSLLFLFLGVFSKSLLGFYPLILISLFEVYQLIINRDRTAFLSRVKEILLQVVLVSFWYVVMIIFYGMEFIKVHFADHLFKRFTKSIEAHFGYRTYYLDIVTIQYGKFAHLTLASVVLLTLQFLRKKIDGFSYLLSLAFVPWFIFLNFTKTKLEWYIYPALPQIVFLIAYPLIALRKIKPIFYVVTIYLLFGYLQHHYPLKSILQTAYNSYGDMYKLARAANKECSELNFLVDKEAQTNYEVLGKADLLISTTEMYGTHPSLVYYTEKKVNPQYQKTVYLDSLKSGKKGSCWSFHEQEDDIKLNPAEFKNIKKFGSFYLYKRV